MIKISAYAGLRSGEMTNDSKHTHVRDVLLERTARPFLVACHDELVTSFLQPFTETKLERVSACHPR